MPTKNSHGKKGRGKLGVLVPLLGNWKAEADLPMGKLKRTRVFEQFGSKYIRLNARWKHPKFVSEELAINGVRDGTVTFWSFTINGKPAQPMVSPCRPVSLIDDDSP